MAVAKETFRVRAVGLMGIFHLCHHGHFILVPIVLVLRWLMTDCLIVNWLSHFVGYLLLFSGGCSLVGVNM